MAKGSAIARLDIFKRVPKDLTEPTFLTTVCFVILVLLSLSEVTRYLNVETKSDMLVDISHQDQKLNINVDIVFERLPCEVVSLDVQDVMGTHLVDVQGSLVKRRIDRLGNIISEKLVEHNQYDRLQIQKNTKEQLDGKEGCQLYGYIEINRVPGNFHISTHAYNDIVLGLSFEGYRFDYTYHINHVSFGKLHNFDIIKNKFKDQEFKNPLDGLSFIAPTDEQGQPGAIEGNFYLIAVPSYFKDLSGNLYQVYQLTQSHHISTNTGHNILKFNYELSPITVSFKQERESMTLFLVHICAIIGGIFTIVSIIDAIIHKSFSLLFKQRINKLS
ncbi:UNKNOWN [Stylonychia lemnae]|uniref:Uncharacterized protein n=1 Tax=Stylonychia lemnae TaxID=5949 RepID=A0A078B8Z4_STYLE|nr:UNKNOWN [Stylonychia lemnae]|eukprot:CDW90970.1 UNKNOWN [Stylonychia lemnae]